MTDLRQLAERATPGPWRVTGSVGHIGTSGPYHPLILADDRQLGGTPVAETLSIAPASNAAPFSAQTENDAAFIAACSPDRILALLDELDAAREHIRQLENLLNEWSGSGERDLPRLYRDSHALLAALDTDTEPSEPRSARD